MRPRSELYAYMNALADARKALGDSEARAMYETMEWYRERDEYATALGIQVGDESWWESDEPEKRAKMLARISMLMGRQVTPVLP